MANCPNCGSDHIQLKSDTSVNWGRTIAGWALFGVVGGAVGAVTGKDREANACLNCGTVWKAKDLYKLLGIIKNTTGIDVDLSQDKHRAFLEDFVNEIGSRLEALNTLDKKAEKEISKLEKKANDNAAGGCTWGCFGAIAFVVIGAGSLGSPWVFLSLLIFPIVGLVWGTRQDEKAKPKLDQKVELIKADSQKEKNRMEQDIQSEVDEFMVAHPYMN